MASWHDAMRAWERTQPQLFFELEDLSSLPDAGLTAPASTIPSSTAGRRPAVHSDPRTGAMLLSDLYGGAGRGSDL